MVVILNGKETEIDEGMTVLALLDARGLKVDSVVVELNREIVKAAVFGEVRLNDGDHLEVLRFVGGG